MQMLFALMNGGSTYAIFLLLSLFVGFFLSEGTYAAALVVIHLATLHF
jgi:hypothetical protein